MVVIFPDRCGYAELFNGLLFLVIRGLSHKGAVTIFSGWQNNAPCMIGLTAQKTCFQKLFLTFLPTKVRKFGPNCNISGIVTSCPTMSPTSLSRIFGQKALLLIALLSHENFKDCQKLFKYNAPSYLQLPLRQ